ncbi:hypothetical protein [Streptomyces sp. NPDC002851]
MPRSLAALGLATVPFEHPLAYPGRPVPEPALLLGEDLLRLIPDDGPPGGWPVEGGKPLDGFLRDHGLPRLPARHPVLAVGSNASPAQVAYKLRTRKLPSGVPMVPLTVRGLEVGCSAHIGRAGYVAAAPYQDPVAVRTLVVSWLDDAQLAAVDASEAHYRRRPLIPDAFGLTLPNSRPLTGVEVYVGKHGVLIGADGLPRPGGGDQATLLDALLAESARLRELLGPDPESWVRIARADAAVRERAGRIFAEEGRVFTRAWPEPSARGYPPNPYGGVCHAPTT